MACLPSWIEMRADAFRVNNQSNCLNLMYGLARLTRIAKPFLLAWVTAVLHALQHPKQLVRLTDDNEALAVCSPVLLFVRQSVPVDMGVPRLEAPVCSSPFSPIFAHLGYCHRCEESPCKYFQALFPQLETFHSCSYEGRVNCRPRATWGKSKPLVSVVLNGVQTPRLV